MGRDVTERPSGGPIHGVGLAVVGWPRQGSLPVPRLCVFCGSNAGSSPVFADVAATLGAALAAREIGLVYGGGDVGLMGVVADAVIEHGGETIGVIPEFLERAEVAHYGLTQLHVVASMHERKALLGSLDAGFIGLTVGVCRM